MAKRFTDTDKWKRPWFNDLDLRAKFFWLYLLDTCDNRGVWFADFKLATFQVGFKVTASDLVKWFGDKLLRLDDDKYFVPSFVEFQYGELSDKNNAHKPVIKLLNEISDREPLAPKEDLPSPSRGAQDKDKDKDILKGESEGKTKPPTRDDWERLAKLWPRSDGRTEGVTRLCERYKSWAEYSAVESGLRGAIAKYAHEKTKPEYIPHFSTVVGTEKAERWKDTVDWKPVTAPRVSIAPPADGLLYDGTSHPQSSVDPRDEKSAEERSALLVSLGLKQPKQSEAM